MQRRRGRWRDDCDDNGDDESSECNGCDDGGGVVALFLQLLLLTLMVVVIVDGRGCSTTGGTLILVLLTQAMCTLFPKLCCACPGNDACHHLRAFRASGDRTRGAMPCCALFFHHFAPC